MLSGVPGVSPARLVVIGAGVAGGNAALLAGRMGARVVALDKYPAKLHHLEEVGQGRRTTSSELAIEGEIRDADAVIGAVLVPSSTAPKVLTAEMVVSMPVGAVLVDLAIDQVGCFETSRETTHDEPGVPA